MEWFGGKADGEYKFQKLLFKDVGAGFGVKSLFDDPEMREAYKAYGDVEMIKAQQKLARKKDVVTPWFGEWQDVNGAAWQQALLGKLTPEAALKKSADKWMDLKKQSLMSKARTGRSNAARPPLASCLSGPPMTASVISTRSLPLHALRFSYDERSAYLFIAPLAAVLFIVAVFPIVYSFYISLYSLKLTRPQRVPFVGFDNYVTVLTDPAFWGSVERTVFFAVMSVAAISIIALARSATAQREVSRPAHPQLPCC